MTIEQAPTDHQQDSQRRMFPRIDSRVRVDIWTPSGAVGRGISRDLGPSGTFIESKIPLWMGSRCILAFHEDENSIDYDPEPIQLVGTIVRKNVDGFGFEFDATHVDYAAYLYYLCNRAARGVENVESSD